MVRMQSAGLFSTYTATILAASIWLAPLCPATAQQATVKELFEKHDLIGYFAADCSKPVSEQNQFIVHRTNGDYVQRDVMIGSSTSAETSMIDNAAEARLGELRISMANERERLNSVMRVERGRWMLVESARENGEKLVEAGRTNATRAQVLWHKKCG
ncbi:MAG: hypothetical protein ACJ8F3_07860 [Xanthobacteraceae bacterium]